MSTTGVTALGALTVFLAPVWEVVSVGLAMLLSTMKYQLGEPFEGGATPCTNTL